MWSMWGAAGHDDVHQAEDPAHEQSTTASTKTDGAFTQSLDPRRRTSEPRRISLRWAPGLDVEAHPDAVDPQAPYFDP